MTNFEAGNGISWYGLNSHDLAQAASEAMKLQFPEAKKCKIIVTSAESITLEWRGNRIFVRKANK